LMNASRPGCGLPAAGRLAGPVASLCCQCAQTCRRGRFPICSFYALLTAGLLRNSQGRPLAPHRRACSVEVQQHHQRLLNKHLLPPESRCCAASNVQHVTLEDPDSLKQNSRWCNLAFRHTSQIVSVRRYGWLSARCVQTQRRSSGPTAALYATPGTNHCPLQERAHVLSQEYLTAYQRGLIPLKNTLR
jgi:hypothetical protein